ncbi:nitrous oxide reductase accessory protein NosL [uncultured Thioclava sp.]|uniref:nitrous oxide reductase accessory protein NosL n=1 Tax=uncultured Thioclava sp. TaxID=473858 RepID=UPI0025E8EE18|nr:nitrous oxide reductase accessory protein NosL [uncultured Thioclava sp.]
MKRRDFLITTSTGMLLAATQSANAEMTMPQSPMAWTDENGLARFLKTDTDPLTNEFEKYPRCPYCGMMRKMFSQTRHLIVYEDDAVDGTCSLHCAAISLALNLDRMPKVIYAGDAGAAGEVKPLVDSAAMTYVIDPARPGTMTAVSKYAYADKAQAEAAAGPDAKLADFDTALVDAYNGMAQDTIRIRKRRAERRARAGN